MIYSLGDRIPFGKLILFAIQMMLSVFVATVLIANICGVAVSGALVGAGCGTLAYILITKGQSPMFISNSGAFVAPIIIALASCGYEGAIIGCFVIWIVYTIFGLIFSHVPVESIYKIFPKSLIGAVTVVIGINLMPFILTYVQINGETNMWGVSVAIITMIAIALFSHYAKGIVKILPFLLGTLVGYAYAVMLTITNIFPVVDFSVFENMRLFALPDLAISHVNWYKFIELPQLIPLIILFIAYTISAMMEALSDHAALGGIIGIDLYQKPGLNRIFAGEGLANAVSGLLGGLGVCSYGEGVACVGFSKVASAKVSGAAALILILMGFFVPVQAFISSIPACVFAGAAIVLYGFIACSGIKMLQQVDLNGQKNLIIVSAVLSLGISGLAIGGTDFSISATALALMAGIILNLVLKNKD